MASPPPPYLSITGAPLPSLSSAYRILGNPSINHPHTLPPLTVPGNTRPISSYRPLNRLGEGTYGIVHRSLDTLTNRIVATKRVRISDDDRGNGIPITALREISILKSLRHQNIIGVLDVAVGDERKDGGEGDWEREDEEEQGGGGMGVWMVLEYAEQVGLPVIDEGGK